MTNSPTYQELIIQGSNMLNESSESPRMDAEVLMQHHTQNSMAWIISNGDSVAESAHIKGFFDLIEQRRRGQPIAYILGYKEFWSMRLCVDHHVLIPRPDTETLVEQSLLRLSQSERSHILDLGTGSGAIALAIAKERPGWKIDAVDCSNSVLKIAQHNASTNHLDNIKFILSDWYANLRSFRYDLIVSNPPYVAKNDAHLEMGDLRFEPSIALVSDMDGLADIRHIIANAPTFLRHDGWLLVEHGYQQHEEVAQIFSENGFLNIELTSDLNPLPRCTAAQLSKD